MAEDLPPWEEAKKAGSKDLMPWEEAAQGTPGIAEDVAKGAVAGTGQGVIAIPGMGGDLQQLAQAGTEKFGNPFKWLADKASDTRLGKFLKEESSKTLAANPRLAGSGDMMMLDTPLPSSADIQKKVEGVTGPFYEAKRGPGKAVQTAARIAPSLVAGGEGILGTLAKAAGAGATSELAGEGAAAVKDKLPEKLQPYAEPVARAGGAAVGLFTPGGARRMVTPLPMSDERLATVNALRATNPELVNASSAGQLTESPRIASLEGRSSRMENLPQRQAEAYTQGVMRQAGSNGMFDTAGLNQAQGTGAQLEVLRNAHTMGPAEFADLNQFGGQERLRIRPEVGNSEPLSNVQTEIARDPTRNTFVPATDMPGQRYGALKQIIEGQAKGAPTTHEQHAIRNVADRMNENFYSSMPPDEATRLRNLNQQYSNFKTIESIPTKPGENTLTPQQVFSKAGRGSDLETHADQASRVMTPLPEPTNDKSNIARLLTMAGGAAIGASSGEGLRGILRGAMEGSLPGLFAGPSAVSTVKDVAGRVVANPVSQAYLKNQLIRPGSATSADRATLLRLLMTPQAKQLGPVDNSR